MKKRLNILKALIIIFTLVLCSILIVFSAKIYSNKEYVAKPTTTPSESIEPTVKPTESEKIDTPEPISSSKTTRTYVKSGPKEEPQITIDYTEIPTITNDMGVVYINDIDLTSPTFNLLTISNSDFNGEIHFNKIKYDQNIDISFPNAKVFFDGDIEVCGKLINNSDSYINTNKEITIVSPDDYVESRDDEGFENDNPKLIYKGFVNNKKLTIMPGGIIHIDGCFVNQKEIVNNGVLHIGNSFDNMDTINNNSTINIKQNGELFNSNLINNAGDISNIKGGTLYSCGRVDDGLKKGIISNLDNGRVNSTSTMVYHKDFITGSNLDKQSISGDVIVKKDSISLENIKIQTGNSIIIKVVQVTDYSHYGINLNNMYETTSLNNEQTDALMKWLLVCFRDYDGLTWNSIYNDLKQNGKEKLEVIDAAQEIVINGIKAEDVIKESGYVSLLQNDEMYQYFKNTIS